MWDWKHPSKEDLKDRPLVWLGTAEHVFLFASTYKLSTGEILNVPREYCIKEFDL
jgi:hypothetical protein